MSIQQCISQTAHACLLYLVHTYTGMFYHLSHARPFHMQTTNYVTVV